MMLTPMKNQRFAKAGGSHRVLFSWLLSYAVIFLFPIVFQFFTYRQAVSTIRSQTIESQRLSLEKFQSDMDGELSLISDFVSRISLDDNVNFLLNASGKSVYLESYAQASVLHQMNRTLSSYEPHDSLIDDYYIFTNNRLIWHSQGISEWKQDNSLESAIWNRCEGLDLTENHIFSLTDGQEQYLVITYPLPYAYTPSGYIAVLLDSDTLRGCLKKFTVLDESRYYITDSGNEVLACLSPDSDTEGQSYYCSVNSSVMPLTYVSAVEVNFADSQLIFLRRTLLVSLASCILGGLILITFFTRRNYSPVQKLVNTVREHNTLTENEILNEYQIVSGALQQIYEKNASIEEVVQRQNKTIYSYYLSLLLKGTLSWSSMEESLITEIEREVLKKNYLLLLTLTDVSEKWPAKHPELAESAYSSFYQTQFTQRLTDMLPDGISIYSTNVYDFNACIIAADDVLKDWKELLNSSLETLSEYLGTACEFQYYFAVSGIHEGIAQLNTSYEEAAYALSYCIMKQDIRIVFQDDLSTEKGDALPDSSDHEKHLINLIQTGQAEAAGELTTQWLDSISSRNLPFCTAKCLAGSVLSAIITAAGNMQQHGIFATDCNQAADEFLKANSFGRLEHILKRTALIISQKAADGAAQSGLNDTWVMRINEVIDQNLHDENLNITYIADTLGVSSKYLSSIYMKATNTGIIDVIHEKRIKEVKELIGHRGYSVSEAAAEVGYGSVATLNRWFRKYEGISPGQYRSNC